MRGVIENKRPDVQIHVAVRLDINEIAEQLSVEQLKALMMGVGQIIAAQKPPNKGDNDDDQ